MDQEMKLALIPPFELLGTALQSQYHLMLPQLLSDPQYDVFYGDLCDDDQHFVILDNGLAEGHFATYSEMFEFWDTYRPNEVVIPDVWKNFLANIYKCQDFFGEWARLSSDPDADPQFMFVVQGNNIWEFIASGFWAMSQERISTIGIPRHANATCAQKSARAIIANTLTADPAWNKQIHFLGADPGYPQELKDLAAEDNPYFRGMDTSLPYNYAYHREAVDTSEQVYHKRPADYFNRRVTQFGNGLVAHNISTMLGWVEG